ncbi:UNVERIFIED_CONTAM: Lysine-specific demethylase REF6, partial [Sesamum indicum]
MVDSETKRACEHEQEIFSCVTCGIFCFACVAIEAAAHYLLLASCITFKNWGAGDDDYNHIIHPKSPNRNLGS